MTQACSFTPDKADKRGRPHESRRRAGKLLKGRQVFGSALRELPLGNASDGR
jgi:hypothetical protein